MKTQELKTKNEPVPRIGRVWMEPGEALKLIPAFTKVIQPKEDVSDKYVPVQTKDIHNAIIKAGWKLTKAAIANRKLLHTRHLAVYNHPDFKTKEGDEIRIMLTNSYDRSSALKISIGVFRIVCSNGLVVTTKSLGSYNHKHMGIDTTDFKTLLDEQLKSVETVVTKVDVMQSRMLTKKERIDLAERMILVDSPNTKNWEIKPADVLKTKRPEDEGNSLWNVFNTVQENLIKGGVEGESKKTPGKVKALRPLKNAFEDVIANVKYFEIANQFLAN